MKTVNGDTRAWTSMECDVQKIARGTWPRMIEKMQDTYVAIANAIAGGSIALSERCAPSAMVRDK